MATWSPMVSVPCAGVPCHHPGHNKMAVEEERSSSLVNSKMGRSSGIWGVRVKQKVGSDYGTGSIGLIWGDNLGLGWIVFTGSVLTVEHSGRWPRRSWWFNRSEDRCTVSGGNYNLDLEMARNKGRDGPQLGNW
ncbi:hypothetical protein B0H14DRAFT_2610330 [Mycena olivaceomarginata]|nr:hypothetical protein B0H14DRAFT_2610330 [Mycena olivaceomarginata]